MNLLISVVGLLLTLFGLLLIAPQVNKHQIRPYSTAAWILRGGALLLMITLFLLDKDDLVIQVSRILGVTLITASIIMVNHEWIQAGDLKHSHYEFKPSANMLFFFISSLLSNVVVLIGLAIGAPWINIVIFPFLGWMLVFSLRLILSKEREQAGFRISTSLSAHVFLCGILLILLGTWL